MKEKGLLLQGGLIHDLWRHILSVVGLENVRILGTRDGCPIQLFQMIGIKEYYLGDEVWFFLIG